MPDTSKLEKLNRELEKSEKKLRKAINDEKVLQIIEHFPHRNSHTNRPIRSNTHVTSSNVTAKQYADNNHQRLIWSEVRYPVP